MSVKCQVCLREAYLSKWVSSSGGMKHIEGRWDQELRTRSRAEQRCRREQRTRPNVASPRIDPSSRGLRVRLQSGAQAVGHVSCATWGVMKVHVWHKCCGHRTSERCGVSFNQMEGRSQVAEVRACRCYVFYPISLHTILFLKFISLLASFLEGLNFAFNKWHTEIRD